MNPAHHLSDACCADLMLGLVTPEQHAEAVAHASQCAACTERLHAHAGASVRAHADAAAGIGMHTVTPRKPGWRVPATTAAAAAAAAAAVLTIAVLSREPARAPLPVAWLTSPQDIVRTRADGLLDDQLLAGFDAYARHDLPAAITALSAARASGGAEQARRLYLGHALLAAGENQAARGWLESVDLEVLPQPWRDQAERSLEAAWRRTGRTRQADSLEGARQR